MFIVFFHAFSMVFGSLFFLGFYGVETIETFIPSRPSDQRFARSLSESEVSCASASRGTWSEGVVVVGLETCEMGWINRLSPCVDMCGGCYLMFLDCG